MLSVGERLREERDRLGLSQTEFAALGHVGRNSQGKYEGNEISPSADYLAGLAGAGVDVLYVVTGQRSSLPGNLPADEAGLLVNYRRIAGEAHKQALCAVCEAMAGRP